MIVTTMAGLLVVLVSLARKVGCCEAITLKFVLLMQRGGSHLRTFLFFPQALFRALWSPNSKTCPVSEVITEVEKLLKAVREVLGDTYALVYFILSGCLIVKACIMLFVASSLRFVCWSRRIRPLVVFRARPQLVVQFPTLFVLTALPRSSLLSRPPSAR